MCLKYLNKARTTLTNKGIFPLLWQVLVKLKSVSFETHSSIWLVKDLKEKDEKLEGFSDYEIVFNSLETIIDWMKKKNSEYPWMYSEKEMSLAKELGHIVPFVKYKDNIVCYTKVALNKVYIRDYDSLFSLAANKAMFYDTSVLPEFRGKKLPRYLKNEIFRYLRQRNIEYVYAHIEPWNIPSIKSNKGVGFKELCLNRFIRIFLCKFHSNNPSCFLTRQ